MQKEKNNLICLWCGEKNTGNENEEHIFQFCIGGKKTLPRGFVCNECPRKFGERKHGIDEAIKYEHPYMMHAYQLHAEPFLRKKEDKLRKENQKKIIQGIGQAEGSKIIHNEASTSFIDTNHTVISEKFVRALHKCLANVICENMGSAETRKKYPELLNFVKNGGDVRPWSYAVSDFIPTPSTLPIEPHIQIIGRFKNNRIIMGFIHISGIWILGSHPYFLNPQLIEKASINMRLVLNFPKFILHDNRNLIGPYFMLWVVKEIEGKPNPDFLYVLTKCRICGQTNPTGYSILRSKLLEEKYKYGGFDQNMNSWNYTKGGINSELQNDVKKMNIKNNLIQCMNCGSKINFDTDDCFA